MQKFVDFLNSTFGSAGKWILVALGGIVAIAGIALVITAIVHWKIVVGIGAAVFVLAVVGVILYKKFKTPAA